MNSTHALNKLFLLGFGHIATKVATLAAQYDLHKFITAAPKTVEDVAHHLGFNVDGTRKFLRALSAFELVKFELDVVTASEFTAHIDYFLGPHIIDGYPVIDELDFILKNNEPGWKKVYGQNFYKYLQSHTEKFGNFALWCQKTAQIWLGVVFNLYDFSNYRSIVDIGGGNGEFLATILQKNLTAEGILFDLPAIVEQAKQLLAPTEVGKRLKFIPGDFFSSVPAGGDLYIICRTLLNWDDAKAIAIIDQCYQVMAPNTKLVILDFALPEENHPSYTQAVLSDLNLYAITGSANRTREEWESLIAKSKFTSYIYHSNDEDFNVNSNAIMPICAIEVIKN